jgi:hypothetical protein
MGGCSYQENLDFIKIIKLVRGGSLYYTNYTYYSSNSIEYWYSSPIAPGAGGGNSFNFDNMNNMFLNF